MPEHLGVSGIVPPREVYSTSQTATRHPPRSDRRPEDMPYYLVRHSAFVANLQEALVSSWLRKPSIHAAQ